MRLRDFLMPPGNLGRDSFEMEEISMFCQCLRRHVDSRD